MTDLATGDQITCSVTHQIEINGDPAWVKVEISSKVGLNETGDEAYQRVNDMVQAKIIKSIESTAQTVLDFEASNDKD